MSPLRNEVCIFVALLIMLSPRSLFAQEGVDYGDIVVTRWADPTTKPTSYQEYVKSRTFAENLNPELIYRGLTTQGGPVMIVINIMLYWQIDNSFQAFQEDLQREGYEPVVYAVLNDNDPVALKEIIIEEWETSSIEGVIFIGDVPFAWYEMDEVGWGHEEFPIDLYFMDLDGNWVDSDSNGLFDEHYGYNYKADIWVGRLHAYNLTYHGADEVSLMERYFEKNHLYRTGQERLDYKALAFIDDDWHTSGFQAAVPAAYPDCDDVTDPDSTTAPDYRYRIRESTDNRYEHVLVCAHSSPGLHQFQRGMLYSYFYAHQIDTTVVQAHFYNLFACSNSRYCENNYMGGWYVFQTDYGLLSIGSTKTGSMLNFLDFYEPLGWGMTYGEAFEYWAVRNMENSRPWFYGMTLIGDPTLRVSDFYVTGVAEAQTTPLPTQLVLLQNYPNPFNNQTTIEYVLPRFGHVNLGVFNLLGQRVEAPLDCEQSPGLKRINWNAGELTSGVYFMTLNLDGEISKTRRVILMK